MDETPAANGDGVSNGRPGDGRRFPEDVGLGPPGVMGAGRQEHELPLLSVQEVVGALRRNAWILALLGGLGFGGTWFWLQQEPRLYEATALVRLLDTRSALVGGIVDQDGSRRSPMGIDPILSEIMVIRGREVAGRVVDREGLRLVSPGSGMLPPWVGSVEIEMDADQQRFVHLTFEEDRVSATLSTDPDPDGASSAPAGRASAAYGERLTLPGLRFTVSGPPPMEDARLVVVPRRVATAVLAGMVSAEHRRGTDGIEIGYTSTHPELSRRVVNGVALAYREVNEEIDRARIAERRSFLEMQLQDHDSLLADAQGALAAFRSRAQVYGSSQQIQMDQTALLELELRRQEVEAQKRPYEELLRRLRDGGDRVADYAMLAAPGVEQNPAVAQLYERLVAHELRRDSLAALYTDEHEEMRDLSGRIQSLEQRLAEALESQIASVDSRIRELRELERYRTERMGNPLWAEGEEARIAGRVQSIQRLTDELRSEVQRARLDEAVGADEVEIVDLASAAYPIPQRRGFKLFLGTTAGLLFGVAVSLFRESLDRSLVRREDVESELLLSNLAVIPRIGTGRTWLPSPFASRERRLRSGAPARNGAESGGGDAGWMRLESHPASLEAYRTLRTNLIFSPVGASLRTLTVTSPAPGDGKTLVVSHLGVAFAQQGIRVLLVDADLRRSDLAAGFGLPSEPGLSELLSGDGDSSRAVRLTGVDGLHVIPPGSFTRNPAELLGGERMERLLRAARERYDLILLDSPPLLAASDGRVLGALSDGVLLVLRAGHTDRESVEQAKRQLRLVGARIVGTVLNDPDGKVPRHGGYDHTYEYDPVQPSGSR